MSRNTLKWIGLFVAAFGAGVDVWQISIVGLIWMMAGLYESTPQDGKESE